MNKHHLAAIILGLVVLPLLAEAHEPQTLPAGNGTVIAYADGQTVGEVATTRRMEEVIVWGRKKGNPTDIDARYEASLRKALIDGFDHLRYLEEEEGWRKSTPFAVEAANTPRFRWGYDVYEETRLHKDLSSSISDLPTDRVKPATLFRFRF